MKFKWTQSKPTNFLEESRQYMRHVSARVNFSFCSDGQFYLLLIKRAIFYETFSICQIKNKFKQIRKMVISCLKCPHKSIIDRISVSLPITVILSWSARQLNPNKDGYVTSNCWNSTFPITRPLSTVLSSWRSSHQIYIHTYIYL